MTWDQNKPLYEIGTDRGVLYLSDGTVEGWNGLTDVDESQTSSFTEPVYVDGVKRDQPQKPSFYEGGITAFTYPPAFERCVGAVELAAGLLATGQAHEIFNLSYRTMRGNEDYRIHLVYNATASPSVNTWETLSDNPTASSFKWDVVAVPEEVVGHGPTAHIYVDTTEAWPATVAALEDFLYGTDTTAPAFPTIQQLLDIFEANATMVIVDNGDGTWTASGPDDMVYMLDANTFQINAPTAIPIDSDFFTVSTY